MVLEKEKKMRNLAVERVHQGPENLEAKGEMKKDIRPKGPETKRRAIRTKSLALSGILIGIGFVLHSIVPPLFFGIKPDFLLACMFIAIFANLDFKNALVTGLVAGIVAALTTGFPGGQLPSVLDKIASALVVYSLLKLLPSGLSAVKKTSAFGLVTFVGTLISGMVFLGSALFIAGLPAPFRALVLGIVLPTAVINTAFGVMMYSLQQRFM